METFNCLVCNTTNVTSDEKCKQCGQSLAAAKLQHSIDERKKTTAKMRELSTPRKSFYSINGCGTTLLDYRALPDGTFQATRWVIVFGLPIIPLSAYVIEPETQERSYGQETSKFAIVEKIPISISRVLRTYGMVAIGLAPLIIGYFNTRFLNRTLGGPTAFFVMLAAIVWAVYFVLIRLKNDSKAYARKDNVSTTTR